MTKREQKEQDRKERALPIAIFKVEMWNKFAGKIENWNAVSARQNQELNKILSIKV